jgi:hypothetical protein
MIEVFLLFCFVAILSAVVGALRGIAMLAGMLARPFLDRFRNRPAPVSTASDVR